MSLRTAVLERRRYFLLSLAVLLCDQATKIAAHHFLRGRGALPIVPDFFSLWYSRNPGGLFGFFRDWADPWRTLLLTLLPVVAIVLISVFLARHPDSDRPTLLGLALILGGASGNLLDRAFRGEVVDFLDVYVVDSRLADWLVSRFGTSHWPTFNLADSAIVVGAGLLMISVFRPHAAENPGAAASPTDLESSS